MSQPPTPSAASKPPNDGLPEPLAQALQPQVPEKPAETIYKGPVSLWMGWKALLGASAAVLAGAVAGVYGLFQTASWSKQVLVSAGGALFFAGVLMIPYLIWSIRSLRYTITTRLIEREKGLLLKRVDSLDLGRVKDVELTQTLLQRMLKVGTLEIFSTDRTDPDMRIECIPNPKPVYEKLRDAVIDLAQRRGIMSLDR
ncbi:MAG: PH domain-containing protein [Planctomycetes bacterium]|nr:PH domain-containing protein [Planctomycetota bacterium]